MTDKEQILAGNYQLLDSLVQNRDNWKERAEKLEKLLNQISKTVDMLNDSPRSFLSVMREFSEKWESDRQSYLGYNNP